MRVTFPRLADHQRGYAVIERDDGVAYRLYSGLAGRKLPHDIEHLIVERELRVSDGIWGSIAAGTVYTSMQHLRGRRPPHAADHSEQLKRAQRERIMRAELLASLIKEIALLDDPSSDEIQRLTRQKLSAVPVGEAGTGPEDVVALPPPLVLAAAASALQVETARWVRLRVGEELVYEWPFPKPAAVRALHAVPRPRDPRPAATGPAAGRTAADEVLAAPAAAG